ncbi:MAG: DinB family protein [Candidatus Hydrogenedentales bacterium]
MATTEPSEALRQRLVAGRQWIDTTHGESNQELRSRFEHITGKFLESVDGLPDEQLWFPEAEGKWSIYQVCLHTSNAVRLTAMLIRGLAAGHVPEMAKDIRLGVLDDDPGDFPRTRQQLVQAFDTARGTADLFDGDFHAGTTANHPYFGPLNARQWYVFNLMHMNYHIGQINRIKSTPTFP